MQALYDVPAPAKLNLFLHVVGKRPDGYHLLQSLFLLIDWADTLHFERRGDGALQRHDRGDALPEDDLCLRAARALQQASGCTQGADIHIEKRLPSGAGMGGGSSDAASTLLALNRLWGLHWPLSRLLPLGLKLGADVPFFLGGRNAFVEGIGEILHPVDWPEMQLAVLKPAVSIATQKIFSSPLLPRSKTVAIVAGFPAANDERDADDDEDGSLGSSSKTGRSAESAKSGSEQEVLRENSVALICNGWGRNDLQGPAQAASSEVTQALQVLQDRFGNSRMTGSGSAVFARVVQEKGAVASPVATMPEELPPGWVGRMCRSLKDHPLRGWAEN